MITFEMLIAYLAGIATGLLISIIIRKAKFPGDDNYTENL